MSMDLCPPDIETIQSLQYSEIIVQSRVGHSAALRKMVWYKGEPAVTGETSDLLPVNFLPVIHENGSVVGKSS